MNKKRTDEICRQVKCLKEMGIRIRDIYTLLAERYYLSPARVKDIYEGRKR